MKGNTLRPTTDELFSLLHKTSLPTVLVEGKDDIIFYRKLEEDLSDLGIDMLPAGNKDAVLELRARVTAHPTSVPIAFLVDKDLWVHTGIPQDCLESDLITTNGYSIENDLFRDGELIELLDAKEKENFLMELKLFSQWYALVIDRHLTHGTSSFRLHPSKVLDDKDFYTESLTLYPGERYPHPLLEHLIENYSSILRGKSLFSLLLRQLCRKGRDTKFSAKQLMEFGASRKNENYNRLSKLIRTCIEARI